MEVTNGYVAPQGTLENLSDKSSDNVETKICPVSDVIAHVSDKWSIHVIMKLRDVEKMRFTDIRKGIPGISQRMLTVTLRNLERDGLITRKIYAQIPPKVEYSLTEVGVGLMKQLKNLSDWATENMAHIYKSREKYSAIESD